MVKGKVKFKVKVIGLDCVLVWISVALIDVKSRFVISAPSEAATRRTPHFFN